MNKENYQAFLDIAIALSAQKDRFKLLSMIIDKSMELTGSDAGTLYLFEEDQLKFTIMKTLSMGVDKGADGEVIDIPPVAMKEENICAYCAIHKETLNIADVYHSDRFDFSGPKRYDAMTGYKTTSMMAVPLVDGENEIVGVLQLINAQDEEKHTRAYTPEEEKVILAFASQTAIVLTNMKYQEELKDQMWSFTEAMAEAIDARTPYNASHTRNVAKYCGMIVDYINELYAEGKTNEYFDQNRKEQLVMGALLHDIGKMVIPLEVMNKESRLGGREKEIASRLENYRLRAQVKSLKGEISEEEYELFAGQVDLALGIIEEVNFAGFIPPEKMEKVESVLELSYQEKEETEYPFFTEEEKKCLQIVKGTLTAEERKVIESHVVMTKRILSKVHFNSYFVDSPKWARQHHECLNGKGYPEGLVAEDLALEARIIAVADICDALLATDRPYKKALPMEKSFEILRDMAAHGNIEGTIVEYLYECLRGDQK